MTGMWLAVGILALVAVGLLAALIKRERDYDRAVSISIRLLSAGKEWQARSNEYERIAQTAIDTMAEAGDEIDSLRRLVSAHHAAGATDGATIGGTCPVCKAAE